MEYQNYEDYMRSVLGYPINSPNIYEPYNYRNSQNYADTYYENESASGLSEEEIRDLYPEIYHLVYPMVCKVCETNSQPLTRELVDKMTDEVYYAIEDKDTIVNVRIDTKKEEAVKTKRTTEKEENREISPKRETRQSNFTLRDLIKILILNQLLGRNRPPFRPRPPRPPMPPRPPFPGPGRPGMPPPSRPPFPGGPIR